MQYESMFRFAYVHAILDNDKESQSKLDNADQLPKIIVGGNEVFSMEVVYPEWRKWFKPTLGKTENMWDYRQTRTCWQCNGTGMVCLHTDPDPPPTCIIIPFQYDGIIDSAEENVCQCSPCECQTELQACRLCNGDGFVTVYQEDTNALNNYAYQTIRVPRPIVLSENFFTHGINVAVWKNNESDVFNMFSYPNWGVFAIASARAALSDGSFNHNGKYLYQFETVDTTYVKNDLTYDVDTEKSMWINN